MLVIDSHCPQCHHPVHRETEFCPTCSASLEPSPANQPVRLNPFAFPVETDFRFMLLIVTVLGACLFIYANFYDAVRLQTAETPRILSYVLWMIGGSICTFAVAGLLYWWMPIWKIQQTKMRTLTDEAFAEPGLMTYLTQLCREAGLVKSPSFRGRLFDGAVDGQAFGRMGSYYVYVPSGLLKLFRENLPAFRAVVLHELAHLYNADVDKTCFTNALWYAFVVTALPVFGFTLLSSAPLRIFSMSWRVLILLVLTYLTRRAILRLREFYADLRASLWDGQREELIPQFRIVNIASTPTGQPTAWQSIQQTLRNLTRIHPTVQERRALLANPTPLLQMNFWSAFATGMAIGVAFVNLSILPMFLLARVAPGIIVLGLIAPAVLLAALVLYIVGVGTWRMTFAALAHKQPVHGALSLGIGLACGIIVGQQCSFVATSHFSEQTNPLLTGVLLLGLLPLFFRWVAASAEAWLEVAVTYPSPRPLYRWGLAASGCTFCSIFLGFIFIYYGDNGLAILANPLTSLGLAVLWAFPLAAWFWRAHVAQATGTNWLYLDPTAPQVRLPSQPPLRPQFALMVGLLAGVASSLLLFIFVKVLQSSSLHLNVVFFFLGSSACIQAAVAFGVAVRVKRLGHLHGLFSAFVAGCVLGISGRGLVFGPLFNAWFIFMTVNSGGLLALLLLSSASAIGLGVRRLRRLSEK